MLVFASAMNLSLLLLKFSIQKNQILLWESFTDIHLWTLLTLIAITNYLNKLLENISKEQKSVFLLVDFTVILLNYNEHNQTNKFLDSLACNSFIPLILQPTRITSHFNTLIDKIFSNVIDPDIISGNLTATISDHLPQFSIISNMFDNISGNKSNIYERD